MPSNNKTTKKITKVVRKAAKKIRKIPNRLNKVRNYRRVRGRGAYSFGDFFKKVAKPFTDTTESQGIVNRGARAAGNWLGNEIPIPGAGNALGNAASWLSRAFGFGAYKIKTNSLMTQNIAQFSDNGSIEFSHREFVTDISSSTGFTLQNYLINPGNEQLFPWLSTIAKNFEQYEMKGLIFEFKSTSAMAVGSVNTGLGTLIMATDYDVLDDNFASKRAMEISDFATSGAPSSNQIHPVECDPKQNVLRQLFIQSGNSTSTYPDDARFSAMGNFQLATSGMQAISAIGELWVSYHVKLHKPQLDVNGTSARSNGHWSLRLSSSDVVETNVFNQTIGSAFTANYVNASKTATLTAATTSATGTYMIIVSGLLHGDATNSWSGASFPDLVSLAGGATYVDNVAWNTGIAIPDDGFQQRAAIPELTAGVASNYVEDIASYQRSWIVDLPLVNAAIGIPINSIVGSDSVYDIYVIPYVHPVLTSLKKIKAKDEFSRVQDELDFLKKSNKELLNRFHAFDIKQNTLAKYEWETEDEPDIVTDSAINVFKKENTETYTLQECEDRIDSISQLLECSLHDDQITFLTGKLRQVVAKQKYLLAMRV